MKTYKEYLDAGHEYGVIEEVRYPLVFIRGLPTARVNEVIVFENNAQGYVFGLSESLVEVMIFFQEDISPGTKVVTTKEHLHVLMSSSLRGKAISPLGESIFDDFCFEHDNSSLELRRLDSPPPHIVDRKEIRRPFRTGTTVIDLLLSLGKGQREAIIGDPTTGKGSFLSTTMRSHSNESMVIYAAIGKPWSTIASLYNFIEQYTNSKNVVLLASSAEDPLALIYLTPYTAMTLAEYWRDRGEDVLVILDDLTTHAQFYREISLLARRFPGRQSYPGDMFYTHARLLERAGNFILNDGSEAAITCIPVAETVRSDLSSYIVSNLISVTDGHLLFDEAIFSQGRRPAVNIPLSISRIGGATRSPLLNDLQRKLTILLSHYEQAQSYSHFGGEMQSGMRETLLLGKQFLEFISQPLFMVIPHPVQAVFSAMILLGFLAEAEDDMGFYRDVMVESFDEQDEVQTKLQNYLDLENWDALEAALQADKAYLLQLCQVTQGSQAPQK